MSTVQRFEPAPSYHDQALTAPCVQALHPANDDAWAPTPDRLASYLLRRPADLLALSAACFIAWFCLLGAPI